jgi:hypothetical protein
MRGGGKGGGDKALDKAPKQPRVGIHDLADRHVEGHPHTAVGCIATGCHLRDDRLEKAAKRRRLRRGERRRLRSGEREDSRACRRLVVIRGSGMVV